MLNRVKQDGKWMVLLSGWYWPTHDSKEVQPGNTVSGFLGWLLLTLVTMLHFNCTLLKFIEHPPEPLFVHTMYQKPCLSTDRLSFYDKLCDELARLMCLAMV